MSSDSAELKAAHDKLEAMELLLAKEKEIARHHSLGKIHYADEQYVYDITIEWLYKPHTILAMAVVVLALVYAAFSADSEAGGVVQNTKLGVLAACFCILVLGLLVFPSGPFIRPHPLFWRFTFGVGVLYQIFLTILLFQKRDDARAMLTFLDPALNKPLQEHTYADHCELTWENVKPNIFDRFFVGHFVGWVIKAMMLRDYALCWAISISWEVIEVALLHMLPNFAECWWDQWILDVVCMNGLGIYVGHKLCDMLEVRRYEWSGVRDIPALSGKVKRVFLQFTPERWTKVRWEATTSVKRFFALHLVVILFQLEELNAFFLKAILWIPPASSLNAYRLLIWTFLGLPIGRQMYAFITDPACKRIGTQTFLGAVLLTTEVLIMVKFGQGMFPNPPSEFQRMFVGIAFGIYLVGALMVLRRILTKQRGDHLSAGAPSPVSTTHWPPTDGSISGANSRRPSQAGGQSDADLMLRASVAASQSASWVSDDLLTPAGSANATPAASPPASPKRAAATNDDDADGDDDDSGSSRGRRRTPAPALAARPRTRSSSNLKRSGSTRK